MKFEVINQDIAIIESQPFKSYHYGFLIMSIGGFMGILIGLLFAIYPYVDPLANYMIPFNLVIALTSFIIAAFSIIFGYKYQKLTFFLRVDRKKERISKFENRLFGGVEEKEVYEWENIENVKAGQFLRGEIESRPWGGSIYFKLKNRKNVEVLSGKGNIPEKIVDTLIKFMKAQRESEENGNFQPGFVIFE